MINGSIQIHAAADPEDVAYRLRVLANQIEGSCKLDVHHGKHVIDEDYNGTHVHAWFRMVDLSLQPTIEKLSGSVDFSPVDYTRLGK